MQSMHDASISGTVLVDATNANDTTAAAVNVSSVPVPVPVAMAGVLLPRRRNDRPQNITRPQLDIPRTFERLPRGAKLPCPQMHLLRQCPPAVASSQDSQIKHVTCTR